MNKSNSKFRSFLIQEAATDALKSILDGFIMFFKKGDEFFGADEESRIVFARMKNPDEEMPEGWEDEANFSAINLNKVMNKEPAQHVFGKKDIKNIKIVDSEEVLKELKGKADCRNIEIIKVFNGSEDRNKAHNFTTTNEE